MYCKATRAVNPYSIVKFTTIVDTIADAIVNTIVYTHPYSNTIIVVFNGSSSIVGTIISSTSYPIIGVIASSSSFITSIRREE